MTAGNGRGKKMVASGQNLRIDGARLWDSLMTMAKIGPGKAGGNNRQTLTDADAEGRRLFASWCEAAGLSMGVDAMGTMFATRAGDDPEALPVYVGSHLDTQPTGGKFDGVLGVLSALELVRSLNDLGIRTRHPIVVTNWANEEGARFAPAMLASGVFAGVHSLDYAYGRKDLDGKSYGDELQRIGWRGTETVGARQMHAYFEYHIEQGPILEAEGREIGIVTHCQGLWWEMVQEVAMAHQPDAVGGVGQMSFAPNSRNVLPGQVVFTVDIRSVDQAKLDSMRAQIESRAADICAGLGVGCDIEPVGHFDPVTFAPELAARLRGAASQLGYSHMDVVSGAGHDACWAARCAPAVMVFCPCVGGLSHNEAEEISPEWAAAGADVLLHAVLETAGVVV
jgi:N-carbamoyl-L-amino-acid hydrolase